MSLSILIIENQGFDMSIYVSPLKENYTVDVAFDIEHAKGLIDGENINKYDLIILDVMMPPLKLFTLEETENGLLTGIKFFENYIEPHLKQRLCSIIILTSAKGEIYNKIKEYFKMKRPKILDVISKSETSPFELKSYIDDNIKI